MGEKGEEGDRGRRHKRTEYKRTEYNLSLTASPVRKTECTEHTNLKMKIRKGDSELAI